MATPFLDRKRDLILLEWMTFGLAALLFWYGRTEPGWGWDILLLLPLLAWPFVLTLYAPPILDTPTRIHLFTLLNALIPNLIVAHVGLDVVRFSIPFFSILIVCAVVESVKRAIIFCGTLVLAYPMAMFLNQGGLGRTEWLATAMLAGSTSLFVFVAHLEWAHRGRTEADSTFTPGLFKFGELLANKKVDDLEDRIPRLISDLVAADICELAIVDDWRIVKRILPSRHTRDFCNIEIRKSVHERTLGSSDTCVSSDLQEDPWFRQKEDFPLYPYRSYMAHGLFEEGRSTGFLAVYRDKKTIWTDQERKKFAFLADLSALAIQNFRLRKKLEEQATTDGLTNLPNHRSFCEKIEEDFARAERGNRPFTIAMIDLDFFKKINDTAGHKTGDQVLQQIATLLKENTRRGDVPGRLGGDEFALALPETGIEDACAIGDRILQGARKLRVGHFLGFSLSIGCATFPQDGITLAELLEHADQALYLSKKLGRGRLSRYADVGGPGDQEAEKRAGRA